MSMWGCKITGICVAKLCTLDNVGAGHYGVWEKPGIGRQPWQGLTQAESRDTAFWEQREGVFQGNEGCKLEGQGGIGQPPVPREHCPGPCHTGLALTMIQFKA